LGRPGRPLVGVVRARSTGLGTWWDLGPPVAKKYSGIDSGDSLDAVAYLALSSAWDLLVRIW